MKSEDNQTVIGKILVATKLLLERFSQDFSKDNLIAP